MIRAHLRILPQHVLTHSPPVPTWRHCWECMLEVTPSVRCLVLRMNVPSGPQATLVPLNPEAMAVQCHAARGSFRVSA